MLCETYGARLNFDTNAPQSIPVPYPPRALTMFHRTTLVLLLGLASLDAGCRQPEIERVDRYKRSNLG